MTSRGIFRDRRRWLSAWPTPTPQSRRWTPRYAITALVAATLISYVIGLALPLVGVRIPRGPGVLILDALFLGTLVPLYWAGSLEVVDLGLRRVPGARSVGLAVLTLLAYGWFVVLWRSAVHPGPVRNDLSGIAHHGMIVLILTGFGAAITAPVVEEVFFRGFLYRSLRNRLGIVSSSVIAGVLFGLGHTQYPLLVRPELAFFGVVAALLYERTGSLLPGIAMHSFIDARGFELALTGRQTIVATFFALLAIFLLLCPPLRGVRRLLDHRPGRS